MYELLTVLEHSAVEIRQLLTAYDDASELPGRVQEEDPDGTGRKASRGPSRPTEATALCERRAALLNQLHSGAQWLPRAVAITQGVAASMDRELAVWEGEDAEHDGGQP
ncbi:hypothetical protein ACH4OV_25460 [Streptomyces diastaticus]|uniref:DUF7169 domain-containing protein n=1 Tax=Streptomyces diastaticus TaxID=1956 RepID=UPI0037A11506